MMRRLLVVAVVAGLAGGATACSGDSHPSTSSTSRHGSTSTAAPDVPTTDPAAPGVVAVDLTEHAARPDVAPDDVVATFTFGDGPGQLGFEPGQQAESRTPSGFGLTRDGTAVIVDVVNRRLVRIAVPSGTRRPVRAAPDLCDGNLRMGPEDVLYIACQEEQAFGINAFATTGPDAGRRLAGPSGRDDTQDVQGLPLELTPTAVTASSAKPLPYVTATGASLPRPSLPAEPTAAEQGATMRITFRTGPGAPLRSWDVVPPTPGAQLPILLTALPDATVVAVFAYGIEDSGRLLVAHLSSRGVTRAVSFPQRQLSNQAFVQADATGAYVLESDGSSGARLVRYDLGEPRAKR